jgi:predicted aspartyl protease
MGIFRTSVGIAPLAHPEAQHELGNVMVDTGTEYNWIPRHVLEMIGVATVRTDRFETADGCVAGPVPAAVAA